MRPDGLRGNEKIKYLEEIDEPLYVVVNLCDLQQKSRLLSEAASCK
jgi:hypothetical protein